MSEEPWMDAARSAWWAWERYADARTPLDVAQAVLAINDAMSDLGSWLPDWNADQGRLIDADDPA